MSEIPGGFDANQVEPNGVFEAVPVDWYEVMIVESETKPTKAEDGHYLELKQQIVSGPFEGRFLWDRLNLDNPSPQAVQIARGTLSSICRSVGVLTPKDSQELHNLPMLARVTQKMYDGEMRNEIKGYKAKGAVEKAPQLSQAQAQAPAKAPATATKKAAPWGAKK